MILASLLCTALLQELPPSGTLDKAELRSSAWNRSFPVFVWRKRYREEPLPERLSRPFGGTNTFRKNRPTWLDDKELDYYVTNAVGRDILHLDMGEEWNDRIELWIDTRDRSALVREPCLSDPETRAKLFATLSETLANLPADDEHLLGISLGDEVSLTPNGNPLDLCDSETCRALWSEHARALGLAPEPPNTDYIRRQLAENDDSGLGAWLENRRFHHGRMLALLSELAAYARERTERPLGLLGLSGITTFGGVPVRGATEIFDFLEFYPGGHHREYASESAGDTLATVFLQQERKDAVSWVAWEHWLRGGDGLVLWNDALLEDQPQHAASLASAVSRIRELEKKYAPGEPLRPAIAILNDDDCDRASWLRDALIDGATWPRRLSSHHREYGTREKRMRQWLRLLEDSGVLPRVIDIEDELPKIVITVDHLVLGKPVQHKLRDHLRAGGVLVPDGDFGWITDEGRLRKDPTIQRWSKLFNSLRAAPRGLETYTERRWRPAGVERLRKFGTKLVKMSRRDAPTTLERMARLEHRREAAEIPWLSSVRPIPEGTDHYLVCMIPNHARLEERNTRMRPWTFEIELPDGLCMVEWIGPGVEPRGRLPMGEPLLFVIRDVRAKTLRGQ